MSFLQSLKEGLSEAGKELGAELGRLGVQGSAEMAGALFNGNAYVPYGRGQNDAGSAATEQDGLVEKLNQFEPVQQVAQQERGMER